MPVGVFSHCLPEPDSARPVPCNVEAQRCSLHRSADLKYHLFDYFFSDTFCQESEGSAYSYPFFVLCVVVFKGWIPDVLSH